MGVVSFIFFLLIGPPLILIIIGLANLKRNNRLAKVLFILAGIYLLVELGVCGSML